MPVFIPRNFGPKAGPNNGVKKEESPTPSSVLQNLKVKAGTPTPSIPRPGTPLPKEEEGWMETHFALKSVATPTTGGALKINVMRMGQGSTKVLKPSEIVRLEDEDVFQRPIKLNRKDPRIIRAREQRFLEKLEAERERRRVSEENGGVGIKEEDGVKKEEEVGQNAENAKALKENLKKKYYFKKKTKRVHVSSEDAWNLSKQEAKNWILEDASQMQRWEGILEGTPVQEMIMKGENSFNKGWRPPSQGLSAGTGFVLLVLEKANAGEAAGGFKVYPVNRFYRFIKKSNETNLASSDQIEEEFQTKSKQKSESAWIRDRQLPIGSMSGSRSNLHSSSVDQKPNILPSKAGSTSTLPQGHRQSAMLTKLQHLTVQQKKEKELAGRSYGRRMRTVVGKEKRSIDDDENRKADEGMEGDWDEMAWEEEISDDEEGGMAIDENVLDEEDRKDVQRRLMKEQLGKGTGEQDLFSEEEEEEEHLRGKDKYGKDAKKLKHKLKKDNELYDSDDEERFHNPYLSDESSSSDDEKEASEKEKQEKESEEKVAKDAANREKLEREKREKERAALPRPDPNIPRPPPSSTRPSGTSTPTPLAGASGSAVVARRGLDATTKKDGDNRKRRAPEVNSPGSSGQGREKRRKKDLKESLESLEADTLTFIKANAPCKLRDLMAQYFQRWDSAGFKLVHFVKKYGRKEGEFVVLNEGV